MTGSQDASGDAGDGDVADDDARAAVECDLADDCPGVDTECRVRTCLAHECGVGLVAPGIPVAEQTPGDCRLAVCDGAGGITTLTDDSDVGVAPDPCTSVSCLNGDLTHTTLGEGTPCGGGGATCTQQGRCEGAGSVLFHADGDVHDAASGHEGVAQNGATFGTGVLGQAFACDGSDDFFEVPDDDFFHFGSGDLTVLFWVNFSSIESTDRYRPGELFVGHDEGGGQTNKWFFSRGADVLSFHINDVDLGGYFLVNAPFVPNLHDWYHLAVTKRADRYTIYVNGAPAGSEDGPASIPPPTAPLTICQAEDMGFVDGFIDELRIEFRALEDDEIVAATADVCGNRITEGDEACDDGNNQDGDGCSPTCQ